MEYLRVRSVPRVEPVMAPLKVGWHRCAASVQSSRAERIVREGLSRGTRP